MAGGWGTAKNKIRIGVFWDGIQISADGSQARITDPRIAIDRGVNIDDSSNSLSWSGGAVTDGSDSNINVDGSGEKRIKNVSGQWQTLEYGSTKTATFSASFSGVNYAGGTLTASKTITYPARAFNLPAAPSGLSVSGSGNSRTLTWTNNGTTPAPVASTIIRQSLNGGAYVDVATVAAPGNSTTLSNLPNNAKIVYRLYALNSTGESTGYVQSADIYTVPNAPSNASATKLPDGSIDVSYQDNSAYETGFRIQDSADGTSWADAVASTTNRPWNHTSPSTAVTHRYRVAALGPGGLQSAWSNVTNIIQLLAAPNAPTNLGPTGARSPAEAFTLTWKHNPTDSSPQSSREIQRRTSTDGGATWSGWSTLVTGASSVEAYTVAAGTFGAVRLEWQVRTKGQHANWSPWSASSFLTLTPRPLTTIVSPGTTLNSSRMVVQLGYSDPAGYPQTSSTIRVFDDATDVQVLSQVRAGPVLVADFSAHPLPEGVYRIEAWTTSGSGLSSLLTTKNVTIDYLPPAVPEVVETAWNAEAGSLSIATSNAPGAGVTEVRRNLIKNPQGTAPTAAGWNLVPRWGGTGATVSTTTVNTPVTLPDGTQVNSFRRKTYTVAPTAAADIAWQFMVSPIDNRAPVTAGKTYTLQYAWRKSFLGTQFVNRFEVRFYTNVSAGTEVGTAVIGPTLNNPAADTWQRDSFTFTVPATATHCVVYHYYYISNPGVIAVGSTFDATAALAEPDPTGGNYFDGAYSPDADLTPAWTGTANASESVLQTRATVDTVSQSLYRVLADGTRELVANLGVNDTALDETPITNGPSYVLVSWSADGAAAENFFDVDPDEEVIRWFYLWKPGVRARFRAAVQRKRNAALAVSVANYAGRPEAVSTYGEAITENTDYSMTLLDVEDTNWNQIRRVALTPGDVIARSPDGLRFRAVLSGTEASDNMLSYEQATLQLRHVGG